MYTSVEVGLAGKYPGPMLLCEYHACFDTVTKMIMDLEKCPYETTTGINLGIDVPTKTPIAMNGIPSLKKRSEDGSL